MGIDTAQDDGYYGAVLEQQYVAPAVPLIDTSGAPYDLQTSTTKPLTLVFFGYTNCPDICQAVMASIASGLTRLDDTQRAQVDVVFVTTDPARDDEATLRAYLDRFDPSFIGLTGDLPDIVKAGKSLATFIERGKRLPTGGYDVNHGTSVVAIDERDRSPIVWTQGTSPAQFADDISRILESPLESA